ncbi:ABC transporter substrate-binding protein [Diplocloster agilis]|uniref:ABC transporter substrate-binding protein n=1 Tax=Diplocloster agilis TaxID=2850323 RepID=UPI00082337B1|nr:ABC transporter substrate-binding protein [Suonthocola fibrivorans]MCU6735640.1 ABC transporter substrate-binding protein [Suonthocola fibrivorans]SCJ78531.1 Maltose-binding periplasmic proteins/domains [uncultured Clostridium sp.]
MKKKWISIIMAIALIAGMTSGCGKKAEDNNNQPSAGENNTQTQSGQDENVPMGRYVEQQLALPKQMEGESTWTTFLEDAQGRKVLYAELGGTGTYKGYVLSDDGTWAEEDAPWLTNTIGKMKGYLRRVEKGDDGSLFAVFFDDNYTAHIFKTIDGENAEEINIPELASGGMERISCGWKIMESGDILIAYMQQQELVLYSGADGSELKKFKLGKSGLDDVNDLLDVEGNRILTLNEDAKGFVVYDADTGQQVDSILLEEQDYVDGIMRFSGTQEYLYLDPVGLRHMQAGGTIQETVIDGSLCSVGIPGIAITNIVVGDNDDYYVLYKDDQSVQLAYYVYDANVATVPSVKLSIYGLEANDVIARAVGKYQINNPDVQVSYTTAETDEGASTTSDYIRALNTELLSGKGADILVLDGLPVDSYIEKGVLADLSDILKPMLESGELLENIINCYADQDGRMYGIPARFSVPILVGDEDVMKAMSGLDTLKQYAEGHPDTPFMLTGGKTFTYEELAKLLLSINYQEIVGDGSKLDQESVVKFLDTVQSAGNALGATVEPEPIPPLTEEEMKEWIASASPYWAKMNFHMGDYPVLDHSAAADEMKGIDDLYIPTTMVSDYGKSISTVNGLFIPSGMIGVNSASGQSDLAKDFVKFLLSEEEQNTDLGNGFPVNAKSLDSWCTKVLEYSTGASMQINGETIYVSADAPTKEEITSFIDMARELRVPLNMDRVFKEMILDESKAFFAGSASAEKAADAICKKANTYQAE